MAMIATGNSVLDIMWNIIFWRIKSYYVVPLEKENVTTSNDYFISAG